MVEETARLTIEKKKLGKKEARVTSLQETLQTMQEMEADNRRKAEELAAMDEMMRGKMEEMQKMQKMMQSMMAQVMAGMGDLDGTGDEEEMDEDSADVDAAGKTISEADKQKQMIHNLVAKVDGMVVDLKASNQVVADKLVAVAEQMKEAEAEKARLAAVVEENAIKIASASMNIDNCLDVATLNSQMSIKTTEMATLQDKANAVLQQVASAEGTVAESKANLEEHETSVNTLTQLVHDTHLVMADWEVKMRKHVQKRKRLVALSNTFNVDVQDVQNRVGDEQSHWKEQLKPLISNAIEQLVKLQAQLDRDA